VPEHGDAQPWGHQPPQPHPEQSSPAWGAPPHGWAPGHSSHAPPPGPLPHSGQYTYGGGWR
jgi:hypothetical protein